MGFHPIQWNQLWLKKRILGRLERNLLGFYMSRL
ncbi:hypothetical protein BVRB_4g077730 [Beta vulgaris subsp. vulgaris]|nr:hypothetical protein BVRB_4g077730 [Beta vulgaris subsp. vulgaris]